MSDRTVSVGLKIEGDAKGAKGAVGEVRQGLSDLKDDSDKVKLLEGGSLRAKELSGELERLQTETKELAEASARVKILESAIASVDQYKLRVTEANAEVRKIQATLSEAYSSGADNSLLSDLERRLRATENAAKQANSALETSKGTLVKLNLEAEKTGISTGNLAEKKLALDAATKKLTTDFDALKSGMASFEAAEHKTAATTASLNAAFDSLGIRSAKQIEQDIQQVNRSLLTLATRADISGQEFDRAFAAGQARIKQLTGELSGTAGAVDHVSLRAGNMLGLMAQLGVAFSGVALAREFVRVNVELENSERTFRAVTGSVAAASREMEYARGVANRLGIEQISTAKSYADLLASTKNTAAEGAATRAVFESVSHAMSVAGKSAADTQGALNALSQMASKGVVQMEELRGQLGDRLPGALDAVAKGLGITQAQLIKLVDSGRMTAEELFPALAAGLDKLYQSTGKAGEQADTASQSWARLQNSVTDTLKVIADTGAWAATVAFLGQVAIAVRGLTGGFVLLGKIIGITFGAIFSFDPRHPIDSITNYKNAVVEAADDIQKKLDAANRKTESGAEGQQKLAAATAQAGAAAANAAPGWTKLNVAFGELEETTEKATKQAVANAEARKAEGAAAVELAKAFGTEIDKREAKIEATRNDAIATSQLAERRREELATYKGHLEALQREVDAKGQATEAQQKVIDELKKTVDARQADADKAEGQARSSSVAAAAAVAEAAAYGDNSKRLGELKAAYEQATQAVEALRAKKKEGVDVTRQLEDAELLAGQAAKLYRDALADQVVAIQANAAAKQSAIAIEQAGIRLEIARMQSIHDVAKAMGDEQLAADALLQIKQMEIELAALTAKAKRAEADSALILVKARRAELEASDQLTTAKKAELDAQEAAAKVKQVEADIADVTAERLRQLTAVTDDSAAGAERAAGSYDKLAKSLQGVGSAADTTDNKLSNLNVRQAAGGSQTTGIDFKKLARGRGASEEEVDAVVETANTNLNKMLAARTARGAVSNEMSLKALISLAVDNAIGAKRGATTDGAVKTHRVELISGSQKSSLFGPENDVRKFLDILDAHKMTSSS